MNFAVDVAIFAASLCVGTLINWVVYGLSYHSRHLNPWADAPQGCPPRTWLDRLPVIGWIRLRREAKVNGHWFWIRPILIELAYAGGIVWLFHFETGDGLLPRPFAMIPPSDWYPMFAVHAILIALLTAATFIDFDERIIPDFITLPGAIFLLILTTLMPTSHLPAIYNTPKGLESEPLQLNTDQKLNWPENLNSSTGLLLGLAIVFIWWIGMIHVTMTLRQGWVRAFRYYMVSFIRHNFWWHFGLRNGAGRLGRGPGGRHILSILSAAIFALVAIGVVFTWRIGGPHWQALLTSLAGLGFAAGLVWGVRIGGYIGLRREAMGFGDVTLMTVIGVALGWQAALLVFFLSPFTAAVIALTQFILTRRQDIAFGPYLALAAVVVIVGWSTLWEQIARRYFNELGNEVILQLIIAFLFLMTGMLWVWRMIKEKLLLLFGAEQDHR